MPNQTVSLFRLADALDFQPREAKALCYFTGITDLKLEEDTRIDLDIAIMLSVWGMLRKMGMSQEDQYVCVKKSWEYVQEQVESLPDRLPSGAIQIIDNTLLWIPRWTVPYNIKTMEWDRDVREQMVLAIGVSIAGAYKQFVEPLMSD